MGKKSELVLGAEAMETVFQPSKDGKGVRHFFSENDLASNPLPNLRNSN